MRYKPRVRPDIDHWLPDPTLRINHRRETAAEPDRVWEAARTLRLTEAGLLGRLVRWRIPGLRPDVSFEQLFSDPPFTVLDDRAGALVSGLVGRIWTLRRDYPRLADAEDFRSWATRGTARVLFAHWVEEAAPGRTALVSESRVEALGVQGRVGVGAVRPLIHGFHNLVATDGIQAAVRRAEGRA